MFPHNNHNQFISQTPPPPHFGASSLADGGPNGRGGGMSNALGMGVGGGGLGNIAPVAGMGGIDWAQLAQQWIHMRDTAPPAAAPAPTNFAMIPMAPPPPIISNAPAYQRHLPQVHYEEHGEADMDMDDDTERAHSIEMQMSTPPPLPVQPSLAMPQITQSVSNSGSGRGKQQEQWANWTGQSNKPATSSPTSHIPSLLKLNVSNPNEPHVLPHQHPPSHQHQQQLLHPQQQQHHHQQHHHPLQQEQQQQSPQMDASGAGNASEIDTNKRKMLPAWIREGLEKMEREKQRQLERQQPLTPAATETNLSLNVLKSSTDHHEHPNLLIQQGHNVKQVSSKTLTTPVNLMNLPNVPSDSEDSNEEFSEEATSGHVKGKDMLIRRRRSDSRSSPNDLKPVNENVESPEQKQQESKNRKEATTRARQAHDNGKNYEERLADLMLVVRRTLTEILLETTNEEIAAIANETMKAHRAKASSAQVIRKSALSSITGNLGLAAYGDSSSESEGNDEEDDNDNDDKDSDVNDIGYAYTDSSKDATKNVHQLSAEELKARIRRSKRSFEKVINDIEHRVAQQEQRDELELEKHRKLEMDSHVKKRESSDRSLTNPQSTGETVNLGSSSNEKLKHFNGKRSSRKERTTRFSDNKDGKQSNQSFVQHVVAAAAVAPAPMPPTSTNTPTLVPSKIKAVPNVATNLLQMPESIATMLNAADKALQKVNKSTRKPKSKRRRSSSSSSSSSSSGSSSSTSSSSSSSSDSTTSGTTKSSSSRSIKSKKKSSTNSHRTASSSRNSRHHRKEESSSSRSRSRNKYDRREYDREREHRHQYSSNSSSSQHRRRRHQRDSSHSGDEHRDRHRSTRHGGGGKDYGKKRHHTRSRSRSRSRTSQHHHHSVSHSSSSSASHHRKRV